MVLNTKCSKKQFEDLCKQLLHGSRMNQARILRGTHLDSRGQTQAAAWGLLT
jgi:hypothetical protein